MKFRAIQLKPDSLTIQPFLSINIIVFLIYSVLLDLVNEDREDLAREVKKVDYLLGYTSICIKQKDFKEAKFTIKNIEERLENLQRENVNIEYLQYLYEGIKKKMK